MRISIEKLAEMFPQSLVSEFYRVFGLNNTQLLMTVFGGTKLEVPSTQDLEDAMRDIAIYESLKRARDLKGKKRLTNALAQQYGMPKRRVRGIFSKMRRLQRLNEKLRKADKAIGQHSKTKLRARRKPRKLRMQ
jgi:hypothetical protein